MTDTAETLKIFPNSHEGYLVPGMEEDKIHSSEPEYKMPVHVIPDKG